MPTVNAIEPAVPENADPVACAAAADTIDIFQCYFAGYVEHFEVSKSVRFVATDEINTGELKHG